MPGYFYALSLLILCFYYYSSEELFAHPPALTSGHSWESIIGFPPSDGSGDYLAVIPQGRLNRILLEAKKEEKKEGKRNKDHPGFPGQPTQYIGRAKASGEFTEHCKHHNSFFKPGHVCYKKDKGNGPWRRP